MRLPRETYQIQQTIETHLPHLTQTQLTGLAWWVCGTILAGSACQNAVASALSTRGNWNSLRQYLREWLYDGGDRARPCMPERWVVAPSPILRAKSPDRHSARRDPQPVRDPGQYGGRSARPARHRVTPGIRNGRSRLTPLTLAYGTRVEDAYDRRMTPGSLRAPPKALAPTHRSSREKPGRTVSVTRHGITWLRQLLHRGRSWSRVWLLPEPWPEPKSNLEVTRHAPA